MTTTHRPLATLPKAHLHVHLEGAMRPSTLFELCEAQGADVPTIAGRYGTFADFQELYVTARRSIASLDDLARLVGEVVADAAADGAVWIEPAVHVPGYRAFGPDDAILDALVDAGRRASDATGVGVGWLVSVDRTLSPALAVEQATLAARYVGNGVVAMGLANDEAGGAPEPFGPAFAIARAAGIISAPHAGEHCGPESVRGALDALGGRSDPAWRPSRRGRRSRAAVGRRRGLSRRVPDVQRVFVRRVDPGRPPAAEAFGRGGVVQHQRRRSPALRGRPPRRVRRVPGASRTR